MKHRILMVPLACCLTIASGAGSAGAEDGKQPFTPPELEALAFLIGDWDLETSFAQPDGVRRTVPARLSARYAAAGLGILVEEVHSLDSAPAERFVNSALYLVHPETRRLVGTSINTLGNRKQYEVTVGDDTVEILQSGELFGGRRGVNRRTFSNIQPDRHELRLDACDLEGKKCSENTYSYVARRRIPRERTSAARSGSPRELAERYLERYGAQDLEGMTPLLAENAVFQDSVMHLTGRDQVVAGLARAFASLTPGSFELSRWIESGPRLVAVDGIAHFGQTRSAEGRPAAELRFAIPMVVVLEIEEGLIVRHLDVIDVPSYVRQREEQLKP